MLPMTQYALVIARFRVQYDFRKNTVGGNE